MKFKDILPLMFGIDYVDIEECGELHIYDFKCDIGVLMEYGQYYVHGISGLAQSQGEGLYIRLDREPLL